MRTYMRKQDPPIDAALQKMSLLGGITKFAAKPPFKNGCHADKKCISFLTEK